MNCTAGYEAVEMLTYVGIHIVESDSRRTYLGSQVERNLRD